MKQTAAWVLALFVLAGCTGTEPAEGPGPDAQPDAGQPAVHGFILDAAIRPVPDAIVEVLETGDVFTTDVDGRYEFATLPVDEPLILSATADGYLAASKRVTLRPDQPIRLNFTLEPVPVLVPYHDLISKTAFINCQFVVDNEEDPAATDCSGGSTEDQDQWEFSVAPELAGIAVEVYWEPQQELAKFARARLETLGYGELNTLLAEGEGQSPLQLRVSQANAQKYYAEGGRVLLTLEPSGNNEALEAAVGAAAAVQQEYEMFAGLFYVEPPPATWTVEDG